MPSHNVELTDHFDQFIDEQLEAGQYSDASEVLRAGLRLLEQQTRAEEEKLSLLRSLALQGFEQLDQGQGIETNGDEQLADFVGQIGRRTAMIAEQPSGGD